MAVVDVKSLPPGDPKLVQAIIEQVKAQGTFDELRKELISDVDTKPAYQVRGHHVTDSLLLTLSSALPDAALMLLHTFSYALFC